MNGPLRPDRPVADAVSGHWVDRHAPAALRPYLRLARIERPIGWWLLLLPCWWSTALAGVAEARGDIHPITLLALLVGAVAMRGAGSTYNDIVDRDLDAQVARTRSRPLPSGQVTARQALLFLGLQALVGLLVLLSFNRFAVVLGVASLAPVAIYPFMKRIMPLPQLVLGLAFAWGGLMGWATVFGTLNAPALLVYLGALAWVVGYDTIYAVQDIEDDEIAGIKSSARLFGAHVRSAIALCYTLTVVLILAAILRAGAGPLSLLGLLAFATHLAWQVFSFDARDGARALSLFRANRDAGLLLFAGLAFDAVV